MRTLADRTDSLIESTARTIIRITTLRNKIDVINKPGNCQTCNSSEFLRKQAESLEKTLVNLNPRILRLGKKHALNLMAKKP